MRILGWIFVVLLGAVITGAAWSHRESEHYVDIRTGRMRHTKSRAFVLSHTTYTPSWISEIVDPEGTIEPDWRFAYGGTDGFLGGMRRDGRWGSALPASRNIEQCYEMGFLTDEARDACAEAIVAGWARVEHPNDLYDTIWDLSTELMVRDGSSPASPEDIEPYLVRIREGE